MRFLIDTILTGIETFFLIRVMGCTLTEAILWSILMELIYIKYKNSKE